MGKFLDKLKRIDSLYRLLGRLILFCVLAFLVTLPLLGVEVEITLTSVVIIILFAIHLETDSLKYAIQQEFEELKMEGYGEYSCGCPEGDRCEDVGGYGCCMAPDGGE